MRETEKNIDVKKILRGGVERVNLQTSLTTFGNGCDKMKYDQSME